jgi:hypothetical protein
MQLTGGIAGPGLSGDDAIPHPQQGARADDNDLDRDKFAASTRPDHRWVAKLNVIVLSASVDVHPPTANAAAPKRTPAHPSARLTNGRSGDTNAGNPCPKGTTAKGDLGCQTIRLMNRRSRHGLR